VNITARKFERLPLVVAGYLFYPSKIILDLSTFLPSSNYKNIESYNFSEFFP
jgi:hypothetical protein